MGVALADQSQQLGPGKPWKIQIEDMQIVGARSHVVAPLRAILRPIDGETLSLKQSL